MRTETRPHDCIALSVMALLTSAVVQVSAADARPPSDTDTPIGFATVGQGTTGGGNAIPTRVTNFAELKAAAQDDAPQLILVSGTIKTTDGGGSPLEIGGDKTIVGADKHATICGGIAIKNVNNVIVRNLNIQGTWPDPGPDDTIAVSIGKQAPSTVDWSFSIPTPRSKGSECPN